MNTTQSRTVPTEVDKTVDVVKRIEALQTYINLRMSNLKDQQSQEVLCEYIRLLPRLVELNDILLVNTAVTGVRAVLLDSPAMPLSKGIILNLEERIKYLRNPLTGGAQHASPPVKVLMGLAAALVIASIFAYFIDDVHPEATIARINQALLLLVAFFGGLGSIVSIMVRIKDFAGLKNVGDAVLFSIGLFKPVIGASFALFVFMFLNSGLAPIVIENDQKVYFFTALAFVSGFSERFAQDIVSRSEGSVSNKT